MLRFYISESFRIIMRAKLASFISIITMSISITLVMVSFALFFLSNKIESSLKSKMKVNVFIENSATSTEVADIKSKILKTNVVHKATFISKEEAYKSFMQSTGNNFKKILELNPLPQSYLLSFKKSIDKKQIENLVQKVIKMKGVETVDYDYDLTFKILDYISSMKIGVLLLAILFSMLSFYLLFSISKLIIAQRMPQYTTMKLVGAKLSTIKIPLLLTGLLLGFVASLICIVIFSTIYIFTNSFRFDNYIYFINFVFMLLGVIIGPIGIGFYTKKLSLKIDSFQ